MNKVTLILSTEVLNAIRNFTNGILGVGYADDNLKPDKISFFEQVLYCGINYANINAHMFEDHSTPDYSSHYVFDMFDAVYYREDGSQFYLYNYDNVEYLDILAAYDSRLREIAYVIRKQLASVGAYMYAETAPELGALIPYSGWTLDAYRLLSSDTVEVTLTYNEMFAHDFECEVGKLVDSDQLEFIYDPVVDREFNARRYLAHRGKRIYDDHTKNKYPRSRAIGTFSQHDLLGKSPRQVCIGAES